MSEKRNSQLPVPAVAKKMFGRRNGPEIVAETGLG
jgi:hypothetical protein